MKHNGNYLAGKDVCFGCGKSGHKVKEYFPFQDSNGKDDRKTQPNSSISGALKQNRFHSL